MKAEFVLAEDPYYDCICSDAAKKEIKKFTEAEQVQLPEQCTTQCKSVPGAVFAKVDAAGFVAVPIGNSVMDAAVPAKTASEAVVDLLLSPLGKVFRQLLFGVLQFFGWLLGVAATLFAWVVDPAIMSGNGSTVPGMFNQAVVRDVWVMVRDLLNLLFITVLLISAFSTIFRVGTYHISKVWLSVLLNALLVNFSFPIARLVIDLANVIMYYFLNNMFSGTASRSGASIFANIADFSALSSIVTPKDYASADITYLIASIVFVFILAVTLLVLAALFVVRFVMLTSLIMFSPIGFTGNILPATKGYAKKWWNSLFNYAFFGPIMTFGIAVALKLMETMKNDNMGRMIMQAKNNAVDYKQGEWMGEVAFYIIPIVIIWYTMGAARNFGIIFSGEIIKRAEKFSSWAKGLPMRGASTAWRATGIPGGIKQAKGHYGKRGIRVLPYWNRRFFGSDQTAATDSWVANKLGAPVKPRTARNLAEERAKERMGAMDLDALGKRTDIDDVFRRATLDNKLAIANGLAEKGRATKAMVQWLSDNHDKIGMAKEGFNKVKEKSPHMAFNNLNHITDPNKRAAEQDKLASKFDVKTLDENIAKDEKFMTMLTEKGKIGKREIDGMDDPTRKQYTKTMEKIITDMGSGALNTKDDQVKSMQLQHLALTGNLHASVADYSDATQRKAREAIWKKLNKDNASHLDSVLIAKFQSEIIANINRGKFNEVIKALSEEDGARLVKKMWADDESSHKLIRKDPYLDYLNNLS